MPSLISRPKSCPLIPTDFSILMLIYNHCPTQTHFVCLIRYYCKMSSNNSRSRLPETAANCPLCNSLREGISNNIPFDRWVSEILSSSYRYCQILVEAIQKLYPKFLLGKSKDQPSGPRPSEDVCISVSGRCRVIVLIIKDAWSHREVDIQLFVRSHKKNLK